MMHLYVLLASVSFVGALKLNDEVKPLLSSDEQVAYAHVAAQKLLNVRQKPLDLEFECKNIPSIKEFIAAQQKAFYDELKPRNFPLTEDSVFNSSHHGLGANRYRLGLVAQKILQKKPVTIVAIGGSFTKGAGTFVDHGGNGKPWVSLFEEFLIRDIGSPIKVINMGVGGGTSQRVVSMFDRYQELLESADLVIAEFNYNDMHDGDGGKFASGSNETLHANSVLVPAILNLPNKPAFVYFDMPDWKLEQEVLNQDATNSGHYSTAQYFKVPLIWYVDAVRNNGDACLDNDVGQRLSGGMPHPKGMPAHFVSASLLYMMLLQELQNVCDKGVIGVDISAEPLSDDLLNCIEAPLYKARADSGQEVFQAIENDDGWSFFEDVPQKPGWIARNDGKQHDIVFEFQAKRAVYISYLRSYENVGNAECFLEDPLTHESSSTVKLEGLWSTRASLDQTIKLDINADEAFKCHFRCRSDGSKTKITSILAC